MDIKSAERWFQNVVAGEKSFDELLHHLSVSDFDDDYHLSLLIGEHGDRKKEAVRKIADVTDRQINEIDATEVISKIESASAGGVDTVFKNYNAEDSLMYLKNGSRLCGVYTGYTYSRVKYATPQERYFLKKVQEHGGLFVIDLQTSTDADTTLRRVAQSIITFPMPQSMFQKLLQRLKEISVHGHQLKTERPEYYGKTAGNF